MNPLSSAKWITDNTDCASPILERRFTLEALPEKAVLYITGLGYFEALVNGQPVTDARFIPVISDYHARDVASFYYPIHDTFTHRVYYYEFDISSLLKTGENTLSIQLGGGWYRQYERTAEGPTGFGDTLKAIYVIDLGDRELVSDGTETWRESCIRYSNLFIGEIHDSTFSDCCPKPVSVTEFPETTLSPAIGTPDREIRVIEPKHLGWKDGKNIYDCGENISGHVRIMTKGPKGYPVTVRFSEELTADGELDFASTGHHYIGVSGQQQIMSDTFLCPGGKYTFEPKFVWHGFRYFEITGPVSSVEAVVVHCDAAVTASFASDCEGLNYLFDTYLRTELDNMHGSIPSDCPHRERLGYTGDGQVTAPAAMLTLDTKEFYRKWIRDILDCQDPVNGHVQHTAPFMGGGGGPGGYGCAVVLVPYFHYRQFGDRSILEETYPAMRKWMEYLEKHCEGGLVVREEEKGWCLGDWCTLEPVSIPEPFVNTYYTARSYQLLQTIAEVLGRNEDIPYWKKMEEEHLAAIERTYRDPETGHYCGGVQGADAYAADLGLQRSVTAALTAEKYDALGHFDTGYLGTEVLVRVLFDNGYADTAYRLFASEDMGSFLYMKRHGATTLWENWNSKSSHNHPMFGGCTAALLEYVLGIRQPEGSFGWDKVRIDPAFGASPFAPKHVEGSILTPKGTVTVAWDKDDAGHCGIRCSFPDGMECV